MKTFLDCIPCLVRQALASVRQVTDDEQLHEQILREVLQAAGRMDFDRPPAAMAQTVHGRIRELCHNGDRYRPPAQRGIRVIRRQRPGTGTRSRHFRRFDRAGPRAR